MLDWQGATLVAPADGLRLFSPPATIFRGGVVNSGGDGVYATGDTTAHDIARLNEGRVGVEEGEEDTSRLALPNAQ